MLPATSISPPGEHTMTAYLEHANLHVSDVDGILDFIRTALPDFRVRFDSGADDPERWVHVGDDQTYLALYRASLPRTQAADPNGTSLSWITSFPRSAWECIGSAVAGFPYAFPRGAWEREANQADLSLRKCHSRPTPTTVSRSSTIWASSWRMSTLSGSACWQRATATRRSRTVIRHANACISGMPSKLEPLFMNFTLKKATQWMAWNGKNFAYGHEGRLDESGLPVYSACTHQ
jgi:hypothetical protein